MLLIDVYAFLAYMDMMANKHDVDDKKSSLPKDKQMGERFFDLM